MVNLLVFMSIDRQTVRHHVSACGDCVGKKLGEPD